MRRGEIDHFEHNYGKVMVKAADRLFIAVWNDAIIRSFAESAVLMKALIRAKDSYG